EPAEDETFHSFAYYSEALSASDCRNWTSLLAETPCLIRALNNDYQTILRTVLEKASSRRLADLETRYSDPHACSLCTSGTGSDSGGGVGSNAVSSSGTSYSNSSHLADSPQSLPALSGLLARVHTSGTCTCSVRTGSNADPPGGIPMPVSSSGGSHNSRHTTSPSRHGFVAASNPPRTSALRLSMATTMPLRKQRKQRVSRRSVSGSPSPPATFLDIKVNDPGMSTSSSSSSALNEGGSKSGLDSGSHSYEPRHGFAESDEHSPSSLSLKELQARLMELFPSQTNSGTGPTSCSHMVIAFRYLLPQLLQLPMLQLLYLFEIIEALRLHAKEEAERAMLKDVLSMLSKTRLSIQNNMSSTQDWVKSMAPRLANFLKTPLSRSVLSPEALQQLEELVQSVRRTLHPSADRSISVSEFILDGLVQIRTEGNRSRRSDRIAYLFNNWLLLCKKQRRVLLGNVVSSTGSSTHSSLKVKKRISLEQFHLIDSGIEVTDNNDVLFTFDLEYWEVPRRGSLLPDSQPIGTSLSSGPTVAGDSQSLHSTRSAQTVIPTLSTSPPNSTCSQVGSVLSISTLTSTNTLVSSPGALFHGVQASTTSEPDGAVSGGFTPMMPTAGAAAAAACVAMLGALSATPTQRVTFLFSSQADKADWMAALVYLQLGRLFKRYLRDLPRQEVPLVLPSPTVYRFAAPDSITNIIFDSDIPDSSVEIPVIRAATMLKLIERMTYHAYFDSKTVGVFLMTYRRYIQPLTLLELLIDRFNVPEPDFAEAAEQASVASGEIDSPITIAVRLEKRFRSMYKRRVQYRVLNFLIKWVKDPSFYKLDILPNQALRERLWRFLDSVDARNLANNVANIRKSLRGDRIRLRQTIEQLPPEPLDLGLVTCPEDVKLANVHPLELARQITLHEWELYSRIEFWEVNGQEKVKGPNLQASLDFSNKIKWWLVYSIMMADHFDDRLVMMQRVADLAILFEQMNNLQGFQEARAALLSSPVFRLRYTYEALISKGKSHHRTFFEALRRAVETDDGDTYVADYERKLREVNPPGLPFIAVGGKTHLIHLELKHSDWITVPNSTMTAPSSDGTWTDEQGTVSLVNFWKCHQLADLVEYYLSFQHTPYNFVSNEHIRTFLQTFDPLKTAGVADEHGFDDLMHEKSLQFQPKPPAEPVVVNERQLTLVEQRIASLLNATPPDHRLTVDSREFRAVLHYASAVSTVTTSVDLATTTISATSRPVMGPASPPLDLFPLPPATGSLGRGRSRVPDATRSYRGPAGTSGRMQSAVGGFHTHCCHHRNPNSSHHPPPRGARSASSSPAPTNLPTPAQHPFGSPLCRHLVCSSSSSPPPPPPHAPLPPALPPRSARYKPTDRHPEQFVNQWQPACHIPGTSVDINQSHPHNESQLPTADVVVPTHNDALPENSVLVHRRISSVVPDSQKSAPCLPPRPTRLRSSLPQPNDVPSSGVECDVTVGHNTRRLTASVSPSFLSGLTSSPPVVGSPQISKSTGPHEDPYRNTTDCPPSLPPRRVHSRAHSSVPLPIHSSCSVTSASREGSVQSFAIGLQSLDQTSPGSLPPPLPPKRQWNRSGI
ncbi:putative ras GTP exchange factor son of sevenless, partial [Paragonimus heterotremus]